LGAWATRERDRSTLFLGAAHRGIAYPGGDVSSQRHELGFGHKWALWALCSPWARPYHFLVTRKRLGVPSLFVLRARPAFQFQQAQKDLPALTDGKEHRVPSMPVTSLGFNHQSEGLANGTRKNRLSLLNNLCGVGLPRSSAGFFWQVCELRTNGHGGCKMGGPGTIMRERSGRKMARSCAGGARRFIGLLCKIRPRDVRNDDANRPPVGTR
jgi:hypothetical protein